MAVIQLHYIATKETVQSTKYTQKHATSLILDPELVLDSETTVSVSLLGYTHRNQQWTRRKGHAEAH